MIEITHQFEGVTFGRAHDQMIEYLDQRCGNPKSKWDSYILTDHHKAGLSCQRFNLFVTWVTQDNRENRDSDGARAAQEIMVAASKRLNGDPMGPPINLLWRGRAVKHRVSQ